MKNREKLRKKSKILNIEANQINEWTNLSPRVTNWNVWLSSAIFATSVSVNPPSGPTNMPSGCRSSLDKEAKVVSVSVFDVESADGAAKSTWSKGSPPGNLSLQTKRRGNFSPDCCPLALAASTLDIIDQWLDRSSNEMDFSNLGMESLSHCSALSMQTRPSDANDSVSS